MICELNCQEIWISVYFFYLEIQEIRNLKKNQNLKDLVSFGVLNNVEISNENNSYVLVFFSFSLSSF